LIAALILILIPPKALAWGNKGHEVVAYIAYVNLDSATRDEVDHLLTLNPCYKEWKSDVASLPAANQPVALFMLAATWPDRIKVIPHEPAYDCQPGHKFITDAGTGPDGKASADIPPDTPEASQNIGYGDTRRHQYWHFIDTPFSPDSTPVEPAYTPNALTQLLALSKALRTDEGDDIKSYDMVWVEHLVGDLHQPLHDTSRFTSGHPYGDEGGNLVLICETSGCTEELHGHWDDLPGPGNNLPAAITIGEELNKQPAPDDDAIDIENPADWVTQGFKLAKTVAYAPPVFADSAGSSPRKLDSAYSAKATATMKAQLLLAGYRLADLLKNYLN
jgi:hypothetical protein